MTLDQSFQRCAVLGAGGKMGRGIALLVLQEMARLEAKTEGKIGTGKYRLILIDTDDRAFASIQDYLRTQIIKYAEKMIVFLRTVLLNQPNLVSNKDYIEAFVDGALDNISCSTILDEASTAYLVFEALPESLELKSKCLKELRQKTSIEQYYFSNTSSIPIYLLNQNAYLYNRIVGLHFYNPPAVQRLIEISYPEEVDATIQEYAIEISDRFGKSVVFTKDVPGFIGNGVFMRELSFATELANKLSPILPLPAAIYAVDLVTREYLLRPMGIFQLVDFVGIDICHNIAHMIADLMEEQDILSDIVDKMFQKGITGGPNKDNTQKEGFFRYQGKGTPTAVYDLNQNNYIDFQDPSIQRVKSLLGPLPDGHRPWKELEGRRDTPEYLQTYFQKLTSTTSLGCRLATDYLRACQGIGKALVTTGIAQSAEDVNTVMKLGFHQLYGPLESWMENFLPLEVKS